MSNYEGELNLKIIDYRGGKALLIDSLDIMHMSSSFLASRKKLFQEMKDYESKVDFILILTSYNLETLHPELRKLVMRGDDIHCYRMMTTRGRVTTKRIADEEYERVKVNTRCATEKYV